MDFFAKHKPEVVIDAAAKVGGIHANKTHPVEFLSNNIQIQTNLMDASHSVSVKRFVFLGSNCIYPKDCPQPIKEEYLLTGPLEKTNKSYALAKIAGIQLCDSIREQYGKNYYSLMPCNLYGPGDNFDLEASHVIPGMIRKIENARDNNEPTLKLLGTGRPLREFLYVEDLADGVIFMLENYKGSEGLINIGSGSEVSIKDLANIVAHAIGYKGEILFDTEGLDGTPRKIMDNSKIESLGWKPRIPLKTGIEETVKWYWDNRDKIRK
jgi:GDP-L-fucose synthase